MYIFIKSTPQNPIGIDIRNPCLGMEFIVIWKRALHIYIYIYIYISKLCTLLHGLFVEVL